MAFRVAGPISTNPSFVGGANGLFVSTANQTNLVQSNLVALDTQIDGAVGMSNSGGVITFSTAGKFNVVVELFWTSTSGANPTISQWLTLNGTPIPYTTQDFQLLGGANTVQTSICVWQVNVLVGNTLSAYWYSSGSAVSLAYQGALTNPTRPASPSALMSITQVS